jgi:hypothetical protein
MDPEDLQAIANRDQLWAGLRPLLPEIAQIAGGEFQGSEREHRLIQVLARIVLAEVDFQRKGGPNHGDAP